MKLHAIAAILILGWVNLASGQPASRVEEARAILREASALVPITGNWALASNIAAQQTRAGDDKGASQTRALVKAPEHGGSTSGGMAYNLALQGRLPEALKLVEAEPEGQGRATAYLSVAGALLSTGKLDDALAVAHRISQNPDETEPFLGVLLQIYAAQVKAGDRQHAAATIQEAIALVDREPELPPPAPQPITSTPVTYDNLSFLCSNCVPTSLLYSVKPRMYESSVKALVSAGEGPPLETR